MKSRNVGMDNHAWRGGIRFNAQGYLLKYQPEHHYADVHNNVMYHRVVYESYNKCSMLPWGIVHHKDNNKRNNFPSNLEAMMNYVHDSNNMKQKRGKFIVERDSRTGRFV